MISKPREVRFSEHQIEEYYIRQEPFYIPLADEIELFAAAYAERIPVLLKGPTGTGKTRFVEYMAYRLGRPGAKDLSGKAAKNRRDRPVENGIPLVTIACHEDLTASDLVGRFLLDAEGTRWVDGPLTLAVKHGGICYLDEVVEARKDTTVLIHPLTDYRRLLPVEKLGVVLEAHPGFQMVISYNPGYQSALKDLKHSTRQRFVAIEFGYPGREIEAEVIKHEAGVTEDQAASLAKVGEKVRNLKDHGLQEGASTRLLIQAGKLIARGIAPRRACQIAVAWALTDESLVQRAVEEVVGSIFE